MPDDAGRPTEAPSAEEVIAFCGRCVYFDVWALGGGGDCHHGHDCATQTLQGICADQRFAATGSGPLFDLSE